MYKCTKNSCVLGFDVLRTAEGAVERRNNVRT